MQTTVWFQLVKVRLTTSNLLNPNGRRVDPKQEIEPDAPVTNEHHRLRARLSPLSFEREQPRRSFWPRPVRGR